ncbi:glycoside hydrolase family 92 protein [Pedobacter sp. HMF7647]|uniref:Glycoside hydrolase family 92 protein n=1 Tax=Hufsiella arboris TaxID=2695275 RepID=A0A7K1YBQ8_9SPHI|nr:GH92 family glycosyl hydrolase [Hufsiella arboris]MXV51860.1 glycoside hydrolase family 92 protein [Hufsiella arboris]
MMAIRKLYITSSILLAVAMSGYSQVKKQTVAATPSLTKYVDPLIGTGFHGHVFVGASVPFGAVQLGPTNIHEGWDWCSGYHISDSTILGFQHTHLSGTGIGDLGDISVMPTTGPVMTHAGGPKDSQQQGYYSLFSHADETVKPGYYKVKLKRYNIGVQLTATNRVGFHEYTFPAANDAHIIIDLEQGIGWDQPVETYIKQVNSTTIEGYRFSKGWSRDQRIYFTAVFSKPIKEFAVYDSTTLATGAELKGKKVKGVTSFVTKANEKVFVKVGISPVSSANAMLNISKEIPAWNFSEIVVRADQAWNKQLSKVSVKTDSLSQMKKFYTAMYHTMIAPSTFNDVNNDYRGTDKKVYRKASFQNTTTYSLWDTYRALHPLYTLIQPERVNDIINTMLAVYEQQGSLPMWHLMGCETNTMVGYSAVPVVVDAYLKGFKGFDSKLAYEAVKTTAMRDNFGGLNLYKKYGFIPADSTVESVAMGLEYAIDDYGISQMAKKIGNNTDYNYFFKRGHNYQNYFDKQSGFMRGRLSETEWRTPFSPFVSRHRQDDYTEGNAWQYTWLVPQDVEGLVKLMGGKDAFIKKLDSLFIAKGDMGKEASPDVSGLIGQYAHGNEPSHHITYLYSFVDQPWKTAENVRFILNNFYTDKPDGIIGNEDVGQMSAWYVLSSLGFYQVNPVSGQYVFGSPTINSAVISLPENKTFTIDVQNNSSKNIYIDDITLNGKKYDHFYISYQDVMNGGKLVIRMTDKHK